MTKANAESGNKFSDLRSLYLIYLQIELHRRSALGPYFRSLYQIFEFVESSSLDEDTKLRYSKIARAQISEAQGFLLALNGLTKRGAEFRKYIEKYGLLQHMHNAYKKDFGSLLENIYTKRAFSGSEERRILIATEPPALCKR